MGDKGNSIKIVKVNEYKRDITVLPCPFCGEKEEIYFEGYETKVGARWRILCASCMAGIDRGYDQNALALVDIWNKRSECN